MAHLYTDPSSLSQSGLSISQLGSESVSPVSKSLTSSRSILTSYLTTFLFNLHFYFDVTHSYILNKISLILFPYLYESDWYQLKDEKSCPLPPRVNLQSFDLYIPTMSYITFLLLAGIQAGRMGYFSPEYLGIVAGAGISSVFIDILMIYSGLYFLNCELPYLVDITAFSGYKFLACGLNKGIGILLGSNMYGILVIYTCITVGMFTVTIYSG